MKKTILFVCTGNVFRSYIAEAILCNIAKETIEKRVLKVMSAGILVKNKNIENLVKNTLKNNKVILQKNYATQLNKEIVNEASTIISMAKNHVTYLKENYNAESILFNKLCYNSDDSILDLPEAFPKWQELSKEEIELFVQKIFFHIYAGLNKALPEIIGNHHE